MLLWWCLAASKHQRCLDSEFEGGLVHWLTRKLQNATLLLLWRTTDLHGGFFYVLPQGPEAAQCAMGIKSHCWHVCFEISPCGNSFAMQLDKLWAIIELFSVCKRAHLLLLCAYNWSGKCFVWGISIPWWSKLTLLCHPQVPLSGSCIISVLFSAEKEYKCMRSTNVWEVQM